MATINAISRPDVTNSPSLNLFGDCGGCWLVMACFLLDGAGRATPEPRFDAIAFAHLATMACGGHPASPHRPRAGNVLPGEGFADQCFERAEVPFGQVLEPAPAGGDGGIGRLEPGDGAQQVLVILGE